MDSQSKPSGVPPRKLSNVAADRNSDHAKHPLLDTASDAARSAPRAPVFAPASTSADRQPRALASRLSPSARCAFPCSAATGHQAGRASGIVPAPPNESIHLLVTDGERAPLSVPGLEEYLDPLPTSSTSIGATTPNPAPKAPSTRSPIQNPTAPENNRQVLQLRFHVGCTHASCS